MDTAKVIATKNTVGEEVDVCVRLECDEDGKDFVKISTWHTDEDGNTRYQESQLNYPCLKDRGFLESKGR